MPSIVACFTRGGNAAGPIDVQPDRSAIGWFTTLANAIVCGNRTLERVALRYLARLGFEVRYVGPRPRRTRP